jgi:hypothetical protein
VHLLKNSHVIQPATDILLTAIIHSRTCSHRQVEKTLKLFNRKVTVLAIELCFLLSYQVLFGSIEEVNKQIPEFEKVVTFERSQYIHQFTFSKD